MERNIMMLKPSWIAAYPGDDSSTSSDGKVTVMSTIAGKTLRMYTLQHWLRSFTLLTLVPLVKYAKLTLTTSLSNHLWTVVPSRHSLEEG
jgi:hypothetical protein